MAQSTMKIGSQAPDITLPDQRGEPVRLADLLREGPVVLFFYPKDDTPVCTAEACAFRDDHDSFAEAGATVVGVSSDSAESHRRFSSRHGLPFTLLSDEDGLARKSFGVPKVLGLLPGRVTYVIDSSGEIRHVFSSQLQARSHVEEALATVRRLAAAASRSPT